MAREAEMPGPRPDPGEVTELRPGIRRVVAANPSPMTFWGTNSYILGHREVAVIDPGPEDAAHGAALLAAVAGARVRAVLVTHAHRDHSAGARAFAEAAGAPVFGAAPGWGRSAVMARFAAAGGLGGGEGVDAGFAPDVPVADGEEIDFGEARLEALHTPGHFGGHFAFALGDTVFTGDVVMDWSTTLISPPDGDVRDFLATCARLRARSDALHLPGHGAPVTDPAARLDWLADHRARREREVLAGLVAGPARAGDLAALIYRDLAPALLRSAARNVLAHLLDLHDRGLVTPAASVSDEALWSLRKPR